VSRKSFLFQKIVNTLLDTIESDYEIGGFLSSDSSLATQLNVSRTTIRKVIEHLDNEGVVSKVDSTKAILKKPSDQDYFNLDQQDKPKNKLVEEYFLMLIQRGDIKPGDRFSELELARQSNSNTIAVREFLIRFSRFGLIEKNPRSQWQMKMFDEPFVDQLYEVRHLFEMHALSNFMLLPEDSLCWLKLKSLLEEHQVLLNRIDTHYEDFPKLDQRLHTLLQQGKPNQFINEFYDVISFVFHYHYQWDKTHEKERATLAAQEHIEIMSNILMKNYRGATLALEKHLNTAKSSLKSTAIK
jgi:DNA-binding GntR family transcriptional regulator